MTRVGVPATQVTFQGDLPFTAEASDTGAAEQCKASTRTPPCVSPPTCGLRRTPTPCVRLNASTGQPAALAATRLTALHSEANSDSRRVGWVSGCSPGLGTSLRSLRGSRAAPRGLQCAPLAPRAPSCCSSRLCRVSDPQAPGQPPLGLLHREGPASWRAPPPQLPGECPETPAPAH